MEEVDKEVEEKKEIKIDKQPNNQGMDEANKKALEVLQTKGEQEFIKHVFTDQSTGKKLSYAEMRMIYG
tara:strand:+ start:246 stop:452 length:207 start_codon:yes stop_codon:yes gene_type:complete